MIIKYANLPKLQDFIELLSQQNCFDEKIHHFHIEQEYQMTRNLDKFWVPVTIFPYCT